MYKHFSFLYFPVFIRDDKIISFLIKYDLQYLKKSLFYLFYSLLSISLMTWTWKKILEIKFGG